MCIRDRVVSTQSTWGSLISRKEKRQNFYMLKTSFEDTGFQIPVTDELESRRGTTAEMAYPEKSASRTPEFKKGASPLTSAFKNQLSPLNLKEGREVPSLSIDKPTTVFTKYNKYTFFWVNSRENEEVYEVIMELPSYCTVLEAKKTAIETLNALLKEKKKEYLLSGNVELFELYFAKKNGRPKLDYPSLLPEQVLSEIGINLVSLREKSDEGVVVQHQIKPAEENVVIKTEVKTPLLETQPSGMNLRGHGD
eukprot:TRINITY_DN2080_c0_g2_i3.p1 TRINITY_DN2080_c0_g2~~TRINITY_DN2080_c0_g2_i3.p1  ORF type:complete len:252 (+),score=75.77 TRINITY_DN2080_c0_g2_i3:65-820(+)